MDGVCPWTTAIRWLSSWLRCLYNSFLTYLIKENGHYVTRQSRGDLAVTSLLDRVEGDWSRGRGARDPESVGARGQSAKPAAPGLWV